MRPVTSPEDMQNASDRGVLLYAPGQVATITNKALGSPVTGVSPRFKSYQSVSWDNGPWSLTLGNTYQSSYGRADGPKRQ